MRYRKAVTATIWSRAARDRAPENCARAALRHAWTIGAARANTSRGRASSNGGQDAPSAESAASAVMTRYHSGIRASEASAEGLGWYIAWNGALPQSP